jgi:flavodoxin
MNIAVIVHSQTGTTLKFGNLIAKKLKEKGHIVDIVELKTDVPVKGGSPRSAPKFTIVNIPDCAKYDAVLAGGPVWAFSASPVIIEFLKKVKNLSGKKFLPFVTMGFPLAFMGGNGAISLMSTTAAKSGARIMPGAIVMKLLHNSGAMMEKWASKIPGLLE